MEKKIIKVGEQGEIIIPPQVCMDLGFKPRERLLLKESYGCVILERPKKIFGERIVKLLKDGLGDVEWEDIEKEREDREW